MTDATSTRRWGAVWPRVQWTCALLLPGGVHAQWVAQSSNTTTELRGLSAVNRRVAWVSGAHGEYARTANGGATWQNGVIRGATRLDLRAVWALDARVAWAMSAGAAETGQARIYKTTDGGTRWTLQYETAQPGVFLDAIAFWDARHGIAMSDPVDGHLFVLTTSDGGRTWTRVPPAGLPPTLPGEAAFAASGACLTVAGQGNVWIGTGGGATARVFRSTDRGQRWDVAETPVTAGVASAGIFAVAFRDSLLGVVVGGDYTRPHDVIDNVAISHDGGRSWRKPTGRLPAGYMSGVSFVPGASRPTLVAVGLVGTAVSTDGGESWSMLDSTAYNSVRFAAPGAGWAVGPRGHVGRWHGALPLPRGAQIPPRGDRSNRPGTTGDR